MLRESEKVLLIFHVTPTGFTLSQFEASSRMLMFSFYPISLSLVTLLIQLAKTSQCNEYELKL